MRHAVVVILVCFVMGVMWGFWYAEPSAFSLGKAVIASGLYLLVLSATLVRRILASMPNSR